MKETFKQIKRGELGKMRIMTIKNMYKTNKNIYFQIFKLIDNDEIYMI